MMPVGESLLGSSIWDFITSVNWSSQADGQAINVTAGGRFNLHGISDSISVSFQIDKFSIQGRVCNSLGQRDAHRAPSANHPSGRASAVPNQAVRR